MSEKALSVGDLQAITKLVEQFGWTPAQAEVLWKFAGADDHIEALPKALKALGASDEDAYKIPFMFLSEIAMRPILEAQALRGGKTS